MKKFILTVFLCLSLCACIIACDNNPDNTPDDTHTDGNNDLVDCVEEDDTPYVNVPYDMSLVADLYLTADDASDATKIYIDSIDGQIYIGDILFDQVTYKENVKVNYYPAIPSEYNGKVWGTEDEAKVLTLMTRIARQKNCYLLKSSADNILAEYISAYYIDGVCYLLFFNEDGMVFRIYYMEIEYAEPIFTDGMELDLELYAMWRALSSPDYATLSVKDHKIYYAGEIFKCKYFNALKINTEWCNENVAFYAVDHSEGMELLDRLNEEKGCFVIYYAGEQSFRYEIAVYVIDGVYYSLDVTNCSRDNILISRMNYYDSAK